MLLKKRGYPSIDIECFYKSDFNKVITSDKEGFYEYIVKKPYLMNLEVLKDSSNVIEVNTDWLSRPNHNTYRVISQIIDQL